MKKQLKRTVGHTLISVGNTFPKARPVLKKIGLRTTEELFGEREVSIPLENGSSLKLTNLSKNFLSFQLFWRGIGFYEPVTTMLLKRLVKPDAVFVDVGANVGFFSLLLSAVHPEIKVISFEPNPKNFRILEANANANGFKRITCESVALSNSDGKAKLYFNDSDMSASLLSEFQKEYNTRHDWVEVPTMTLDSYFSQRPINAPLIIKIDVEGHEEAFLQGAKSTITAHRPDLIFEVLKDYSPEQISFLRDLGYGFYPITDKGFIEADGLHYLTPAPFHFFNYLVSTRPKAEIAALFAAIEIQVRKINFYETCKYMGALAAVAHCPTNLVTTLDSLLLTA